METLLIIKSSKKTQLYFGKTSKRLLELKIFYQNKIGKNYNHGTQKEREDN